VEVSLYKKQWTCMINRMNEWNVWIKYVHFLRSVVLASSEARFLYTFNIYVSLRVIIGVSDVITH